MQDAHRGTPPRVPDENSVAFGRPYSTADDTSRTNRHYDLPAEFFTAFLGGEWNNYSCDLWDDAASQTESQEHKLDLIAHLLDLKQGQRVLDVGSGWGGPLVYLAKRYGVSGIGISPARNQIDWANRRAQSYGVDVKFHVSHWRDFTSPDQFDAIYSDEVIVHFNDLAGFFERARSLLKPGGRMLNKELHWASSRFIQPTRGLVLLNRSFGETANYRPLYEELRLLDKANFILQEIREMSLGNYERTLTCWLSNLREHKARLTGLVGREPYEHFCTYFRLLRRATAGGQMTLDLVVAR